MKIKYLKYPKLMLLFLSFIIAYIIFYGRNYLPFHNFIISAGFIGIFLAGLFYVYGFTAAPATAVLLILAKEHNILFAGLIAGLGALSGDFLIFRFLRTSFADELDILFNGKKSASFIKRKIPENVRKLAIPIIAGFIIASPLPDEIGIFLLAASKHISIKLFSMISYLLNTAGIFVILYIGINL